MAAILPEPAKSQGVETLADLPMEFTLHLGPQSTEHIVEVARRLRNLGAQVQIEPGGSLVAFRPLL